MTTDKKIPAGATNTNEDKEQILNTNSVDQYITALLVEADLILDAEDLLDRLIF